VSDESTQTNVSALDEDDDDLPRARQHPLPWILFGFAAILLALVGGLLAKRLSNETRRANEAVEKNAGLKAQLEQINKEHSDVDKRVGDAEAKAKLAEDAAASAAAKLKQVEGERDKLQKDLEAMAKKAEKAEKAEAKEPVGKKGKAPPKKKKKGKKR
jgi:hypothetical protein